MLNRREDVTFVSFSERGTSIKGFGRADRFLPEDEGRE